MAKQKKLDIDIKESNKGDFTAWAKRNGFTDTCSAANSVMKNKKKHSTRVVKMANFAKNFACRRR